MKKDKKIEDCINAVRSLFEELYEDILYEGYDLGYADGLIEGVNDCDKCSVWGEEYDAGFADGKKAALKECAEFLENKDNGK